MRELREIVREFSRASEPMALATIVRATGSSYRRPGARMLILPDGRTIGTLSGGCIEKEVTLRAEAVLATGEPQLFPVDLLRRFGCHGSIEIFVERIEPENDCLRYVTRCLTERCAAFVRVIFENFPLLGSFPPENAPADAPGFSETIEPPVRIVIVGGGAETASLLGFARILGWDAAVLEQPDSCDELADARTAVVIQNHHFGKEFAALRCVFSEPFGYFGLLGSRKRRQQLLDALIAEGRVPPGGLRDFYSPAGLDLGSESPEEIALSIVSEIQAVMSRRHAGFLRDRRAPIHEAPRECQAAPR